MHIDYMSISPSLSLKIPISPSNPMTSLMKFLFMVRQAKGTACASTCVGGVGVGIKWEGLGCCNKSNHACFGTHMFLAI